MVLAAHHLEGASESENDIAPTLAARWAVIELSHRCADGSLFREPLENSVSRETVQDPELFLAKPLILYQAGCMAHVLEAAERFDYISGLARPQVWRSDYYGRPFAGGQGAEPMAQGGGLAYTLR